MPTPSHTNLTNPRPATTEVLKPNEITIKPEPTNDWWFVCTCDTLLCAPSPVNKQWKCEINFILSEINIVHNTQHSKWLKRPERHAKCQMCAFVRFHWLFLSSSCFFSLSLSIFPPIFVYCSGAFFRRLSHSSFFIHSGVFSHSIIRSFITNSNVRHPVCTTRCTRISCDIREWQIFWRCLCRFVVVVCRCLA